jgi:hypothetical protein
VTVRWGLSEAFMYRHVPQTLRLADDAAGQARTRCALYDAAV